MEVPQCRLVWVRPVPGQGRDMPVVVQIFDIVVDVPVVQVVDVDVQFLDTVIDIARCCACHGPSC